MDKMQVELLARDLNAQGGVFCPSPKADMKLWNSHPKVYLDVAHMAKPSAPTAARSTRCAPASTSARTTDGGVAACTARLFIELIAVSPGVQLIGKSFTHLGLQARAPRRTSARWI